MSKRRAAVAAVVLPLVFAAVWPAAPAAAAIVATGEERRCWNPTSKVQLTFDDTADTGRVHAILDVLAAKRVRAGFFITGRFARSEPQLMARIRNDGHWVGNHSATHANLRRISDAAVAGEIEGGVASWLFRPPYRDADARVRRIIHDAGYRLCFWDIDTLDWRRRSVAEMHHTVFSEVRPGAVILAHLHGRHTLEALPGLIDGIRSRGFELDPLTPFVAGALDGAGLPLRLERDGRVLGGPDGAGVVVPPVVAPRDAVAITARSDGPGQWIAGASGGVYAVGGAPFHGAEQGLNAPVVSIASTPSGDGYWTTASDGGVFSHGDAGFFGSTGDLRLNQPVVAMVSTPSGQGYWLVAGDGGVFSFGDAGFFGSAAGTGDPTFVSIAPHPSGQGYWLLRRDGAVFAFGAAGHHGDYARNPTDPPGTRSFLAVAADADGGGYALVSDHPGELYRFR